jgi:proteasome alpha subunit
MSMPFYVAPEQVMKDRADYARKGIARGRSLAALSYDGGVLLCAENPSNTLHKVAEIYDRIAFAGVGKYNEFDQLRKFGVRTADLTGYQFSREDVNANSLANQYAQILGNVFTHEMKPLEVEILVVEVGATAETDQLFHILYDGTVMDEDRFSVLGGEADAIAERLDAAFEPGLDLGGAVAAAVSSLSGPDRALSAEDLEVAVLERDAGRRAFRRLGDPELRPLVPAAAAGATPDDGPADS